MGVSVDEVVVARFTATVLVGDVPTRVHRGSTIAHRDHPIVREHPDLWRPLPVTYPAEAESPDVTPASGDAPPRPAAREGRPVWDAYAVALGLNAEAVAELSNKADVIELVDALESGEYRIGDDGTLEEV